MTGKTSDVIIDVRFLKTEEGGRSTPTPDKFLPCIMSVGENNFDVRLILEEATAISPGDSALVEVKFLDFDFAAPFLHLDSRVELRDYRKFAEGRIVKIL